MSLVQTRLQNWRVEDPKFDRNMTRPEEYGALDFFITQSESPNSIITPELRDRAFRSIGNTVQIPVINYDGDVTVKTARSCSISDDENTSALYTVVFSTYQVEFTMVPALYLNNEISYMHDFSRKMEKVSRALASAFDTDAVAALEAQKTKVFTDPLNYTITSNVMEIPTQMATEVIGDINPIMRANAYPGQIHIIGNAGIDSLMRKLAQHGLYNDVNKQLEYDGKVFHFTNRVENEEGMNGTFFAVEDGNVAILTRVDREALLNTKTNVNDNEWGVTRIPYINTEVGYHFYKSVGDVSSIAGDASADMVCNVKEHYAFSLDVAFIVAYNSAPSTVANPIIKAEIAARATDTPLGMPVYVTNAAEFQPEVESAGGTD